MVDEQQIIAKAQGGDRDSINALIGTYWQPIYRLVLYKIGNIKDSQELTRETFFKAFRSFDRYGIREISFKTYLGQIALNMVTDYWRNKGRMPLVIDIAEYHEPITEEQANPELTALDWEQQAELVRLMRLLTFEQQQAIELRSIAGLPIKEAAAIMGKSDGVLKMLQERALKAMRRLLEERGISRLIDDIHNKRAIASEDREMVELVILAEAIKVSAVNQLLPTDLIAATVNRLAAEPVKPSLVRRWKVTALAGAAAALLWVAAYFGGSPTPLPLAEKPTEIQPPLKIVSLPVPDIKESPQAAGQADRSKNIAMNQGNPEKKAGQKPREDENSQAAAKADIPRSNDSVTEAQEKQPVAGLFTLSGRKADRVIMEGSFVRQIFNIGQRDEIVVTYHQISTPALAGSKSLSDTQGQQRLPAGSNQITTMMGDREITVSGGQTTEELRKIAGQLAELAVPAR